MLRHLPLLSITLSASLALSGCNDGAKDGTVTATATEAAGPADRMNPDADPAGAAPAAAASNCTTPSGRHDVAGIRIGMSEAEARTMLTCVNANYQFTREARGVQGNNPNLQSVSLIADTGLDKVVVTLLGLKNAERVWAVTRQMEFTNSARPSGDAVRASLAEKYGALHFYDPHGNDDKTKPRVVTSADDQALDPSSSAYYDCTRGPGALVVTASSEIREGKLCGFAMLADIEPSKDNPQLVRRFSTSITNFRDVAKFFKDDMAAAQSVEARQKAAIQARQKQEADVVGSRNAPKL